MEAIWCDRIGLTATSCRSGIRRRVPCLIGPVSASFSALPHYKATALEIVLRNALDKVDRVRLTSRLRDSLARVNAWVPNLASLE